MKLYNEDCFKILDELKEKNIKFPFIILDPPYGKVNGMILKGQEKSIDWDVDIDWKELFKKLYAVLTPNGTIAIFGQNPTYAEMILSNKRDYKYEYIWLKNNCAQGFHADKMPLIYTENIAIFINDTQERVFNKIITSKEIDKIKYPWRHYSQQLQKYIIETHNLKSRKDIYIKLPRLNKKGKEILDRRLEFFFFYTGTIFVLPKQDIYELITNIFNLTEWKDYKPWKEIKNNRIFNKMEEIDNSILSTNTIKNVLEFKKDMDGFHPTQKPVKLMEFFIKTYTNEDDTILDPFMGSGSTGVACKNLNRNFIGIELDEKYYNVAKERINENK